MNLTKDFYSAPEVAELTGVKLRTVYRWIDEGRLKAIKITQWRITKEALEEFLNGEKRNY